MKEKVNKDSRVLALCSQKGGVGKTTSCVNLAVGLARVGKKVLVIDNDPQGSMTASLGYQNPDELPVTLATILTKVVEEETFENSLGILPHQEGIDLLPANIELSGMEVSLVNFMSRELVLKQYIERIRHEYDYILIDCILITMVDNRTNYARDISELIFNTYGNRIHIFQQSIPFSVRAAEISAEGISIFQHDPKGKVAEAYRMMTQEVLMDEKQKCI